MGGKDDGIAPQASRRESTPPAPDPIIDYRGSDPSAGQQSGGQRFAWGMLFTLGYAVVAGVLMAPFAWSSDNVGLVVTAAEVVLFIVLLVVTARKVQSNAFVAGALVTLLLAPLVMVTVCAVIA